MAARRTARGRTEAQIQALRDELLVVRESVSLRELAARIGISQYPLFKWLRNEPIRGSTLAKIEAWSRSPREDDAAAELRLLLRRLLAGLPDEKGRRAAEREVGQAIGRAYRRARMEVPGWAGRMGVGKG